MPRLTAKQKIWLIYGPTAAIALYLVWRMPDKIDELHTLVTTHVAATASQADTMRDLKEGVDELVRIQRADCVNSANGDRIKNDRCSGLLPTSTMSRRAVSR